MALERPLFASLRKNWTA